MIAYNKVFLDTAPLIYYLENNPKYSEQVKSFLGYCCEKDIDVVTSVITVEEYCVYPYRTGKVELISNFYAFLKDMDVKIVPINKQIADKASQIRATYKDFKAMDALQLATANIIGCDAFLTNDRQLKQYNELPCILTDDLG